MITEMIKDFIDGIEEDMLRKVLAFYCKRHPGMIQCQTWVYANRRKYDISIKRRKKHFLK